VLFSAVVAGIVISKACRNSYFNYLKLKRAKRLNRYIRHKRFGIIGGVSTLLAIPVFAYVFNFKSTPISGSADHWGQLGDFFGGLLNPVLAFASFMALLYTINIQSKQLDISTKELGATRKELTASREAQESSSQALALQTFEQTFFNQIEYITKLQAKFEVDKLSMTADFMRTVDASGQSTKVSLIAAAFISNTSSARMYYTAILDLINFTSKHASEVVFIKRLPIYYSLISNVIDDDDCYFLACVGRITSFSRMCLSEYSAICSTYGMFRNSNKKYIENQTYINIRGGRSISMLLATDLDLLDHAFEAVVVTVG